MTSRFEPLSHAPDAGRELGRRAIATRAQGGREPADWVRAYEERLLAGAVDGRLYVVDEEPAGFVSWSAGGPLGNAVNLLYLSDGSASATSYAEILHLVEREAGRVAFVSGPLAGLPGPEEAGLMRSLGYRPFGRSEMVLGTEVPLPEPTVEAADRFRPAQRSDLPGLAELHRRAYRDRFDRYLFLEVEDEREDALRGVTEILDGRWGEFSPAGSWTCERAGRLAGAVLSVRSPAGTLIADVMVEPELQGAGLGRRLLTTTLRSLRGAGERRVYLNVTEGNERALRLYRRLGFVRSLGPTADWYNATVIPVAPSAEG